MSPSVTFFTVIRQRGSRTLGIERMIGLLSRILAARRLHYSHGSSFASMLCPRHIQSGRHSRVQVSICPSTSFTPSPSSSFCFSFHCLRLLRSLQLPKRSSFGTGTLDFQIIESNSRRPRDSLFLVLFTPFLFFSL